MIGILKNNTFGVLGRLFYCGTHSRAGYDSRMIGEVIELVSCLIVVMGITW